VRFKGEIKFPEIDHPGVPVTFVVEDQQAELTLDGESLGRWSLYDIHARRLISSAFQIDLNGTEITFLADDPIDFAYRGVEHMAQTWAKIKSKAFARRQLAINKSRKGVTPSRVDELAEAMRANLVTQTRRGLLGRPAVEEVDEPLRVDEGVPEPAADYAPDEERSRLAAEIAALEAERARLAEERLQLEQERTAGEEREAIRIEAYRLEMQRLEAEREDARRFAGPDSADAETVEPAVEEAPTEELMPEPAPVAVEMPSEELEPEPALEAEDPIGEQPEPVMEEAEAPPTAPPGVVPLRVLDLSNLEEDHGEAPAARTPTHQPEGEPEPDLEPDLGREPEREPEPPRILEPVAETRLQAVPEPALSGASRDRSGLMGAVKAAFARNGGKSHEHSFLEAPGGIGITRFVCEECGYVSIAVGDE
jgi:hypothetical protein